MLKPGHVENSILLIKTLHNFENNDFFITEFWEEWGNMLDVQGKFKFPS